VDSSEGPEQVQKGNLKGQNGKEHSPADLREGRGAKCVNLSGRVDKQSISKKGKKKLLDCRLDTRPSTGKKQEC